MIAEIVNPTVAPARPARARRPAKGPAYRPLAARARTARPSPAGRVTNHKRRPSSPATVSAALRRRVRRCPVERKVARGAAFATHSLGWPGAQRWLGWGRAPRRVQNVRIRLGATGQRGGTQSPATRVRAWAAAVTAAVPLAAPASRVALPSLAPGWVAGALVGQTVMPANEPLRVGPLRAKARRPHHRPLGPVGRGI